jgi:hypothetical protein
MLRRSGTETRIFDQHDQPVVGGPGLVRPEPHVAIAGILKSQIGWLPLGSHGILPTQDAPCW